MKRKVIQITSSIDSVGKYFILAVCNDGTLWKLDGLYEGEPTWGVFPSPPQPLSDSGLGMTEAEKRPLGIE